MVRYETRGRCAVVTIDRPDARNAVNADVATGIEAALDRAEAENGIRVVVLTGAPPAFCAGADLKVIGAGGADTLSTERGGFAGVVRRARTKPLIAAVDGPALAGGTEIVLACDLVVASEAASFGIPEVKRGLIAAAGGLFRLGRKLPLNVAMEAALTGDPLHAARAHAYGLVNELCAPREALERAVALADRIAANAPLAVAESRALVLETTTADDTMAWKRTDRSAARIFASEDVREGVRAFVERREPVWQGR